MTEFFVGTSGYSYKEWKGSFYPEKLPQKELLSYYAQQFSTVEINSSFYRMPSEEALEAWASEVPKTFRFALKAPQTITHRKRLKNTDSETDTFLRTVAVLKGRCGPLLFQLPPNLKKDLPRLEAFLRLLDGRAPTAVEFRHASWNDDDVFDCLRANSCALCLADMDDAPAPDLVSTANWGYVRLRRESYTDKQFSEWLKRIRSQDWSDAYVFFKHEETGSGPKFATRFLQLAGR